MSEALPNASVCNFSGDDKNCSPLARNSVFAKRFPASGEPPVTSSAPAACKVLTLAARLRNTPDESKVAGVVLSSFAFPAGENSPALFPQKYICRAGPVAKFPARHQATAGEFLDNFCAAL